MVIQGIIFILIPLLLSAFLFLYSRKKKTALWIPVALSAVLFFLFYTIGMGVFYPKHGYKVRFEEMTGMNFPEDAEFLYTDSWTHGAYQNGEDMAFLIHTDSIFESILSLKAKENGFILSGDMSASDETWAYKLRTALKDHKLQAKEVFVYHLEGTKSVIGITSTSGYYFFFGRSD